MHGDGLPEIVGDLAGHTQLGLAHDRHAAARRADRSVAGHVELDGVDAFTGAQAHGARELVGTIGDQTEALPLQVQQALVPETAGDGDLRARGLQSRPGNAARLDGITNDDVQTELRARGAERAGEARFQQPARVVHRLQRVFLGRNLAEVHTLRTLAETGVRVPLHEPRHQEAARRFDHAGVIGMEARGQRHHGGDAFALHQHVRHDGRRAGAVPDAGLAEEQSHEGRPADIAGGYGDGRTIAPGASPRSRLPPGRGPGATGPSRRRTGIRVVASAQGFRKAVHRTGGNTAG